MFDFASLPEFPLASCLCPSETALSLPEAPFFLLGTGAPLPRFGTKRVPRSQRLLEGIHLGCAGEPAGRDPNAVPDSEKPRGGNGIGKGTDGNSGMVD